MSWTSYGGLVLLAALVMGREVIVHLLLTQQELDAGSINLAGRQRMLSQKIAKQLLIPLEQASRFPDELESDLLAWERAHQQLQAEAGQGRYSGDMERLFGLLTPHFEAMVAVVREALVYQTSPSDRGRRASLSARYLARESQYLPLMNEVVYAYEREARGRVSRLKLVEMSMSAAILFVLLLEALVIFRPMSRRVGEVLRELAEAKLAAETSSLRDGLTGIANRRHFDAEFEREFRRSGRAGTSLAAIMIDLDNFKLLNDQAGHPAGDDCLVKVAHALATQMRRAGDLVARYGGDEFVVCLPDTSFAGAKAVAERLQGVIEELGISADAVPGSGRRIGASVGVAARVPSTDEADPFGLINLADQELYRNKEARRRKAALVVAPDGEPRSASS